MCKESNGEHTYTRCSSNIGSANLIGEFICLLGYTCNGLQFKFIYIFFNFAVFSVYYSSKYKQQCLLTFSSQQSNLTALQYFCADHRNQRVFSIWNHKCLSQLFSLYLNTYFMGLLPLYFFNFSQHRDRLQASESDVYRRQNLTPEIGPRTERVNAAYSFIVIIICTTQCDCKFE